MNKLFLLAALVVFAPKAQSMQNSVSELQLQKIKAKGMQAINNAEYCNYVRIPATAAFLGLWGAGMVLRRLPFSTVTKVARRAEFTAGFTQFFAAVGYFTNVEKAKECVAAIKCLENMDNLTA